MNSESARLPGSVTISRRVLIAAPAMMLIGCGGNNDSPYVDPLPLVDIQQRASERLDQTQSMKFSLDVEGDTFIDSRGQILLKAARGDLARPDRVACEFQVSVFGATNVSIRMISIGEQSWTTDLLTGRWTTAPPEFGYNPRILYDNQNGLGPVVGRIENPVLEPSEEVGGEDSYHIKGTTSQATIGPLTSGTLIGESIGLEIWISKLTLNLMKVKIEEPRNPEKDRPAVWTMNLSKHDQQVSIVPPD